ncbi:MAG: type II secretion system protein [bacterium]|nr:type II secretion system protein [bacterium]
MKYIQRGFTLIELLVVVGIISLIASVGLISMNEAREKARDAKRLADLNEIQKLVELYKSDNNGNPPGQEGTEYINGVPNWIPGLSPRYIKELPSDPLDADPYQYHYQREGNDYETAGILEKSSNEASCNDGGSGGCRFFEVGTKLTIFNPSEGAWHAASSSVLTPGDGETGTTTPPDNGGGGTGTTTTATPVSAPTETILGWFKGITGSGPSLSGTYTHAFYFKYSTTVNPNQSFRVYLKRPGESAYTAVATFTIPVSIPTGGCNPAKEFSANGWKIECSTYPYWRVFGPAGTAANYSTGVYYAYVAAVDEAGTEGTLSPVTQNHLLNQSLITSPVGAQSTTTPTITWTIPTWSGINMVYWISVYTADETSIWTESKSVLSGTTTANASLQYAGPALSPGVTYYTNLWGETRENPNSTYAFTMTNNMMPAFTVAEPAAQGCPVSITSLTPSSGPVGTAVYIRGNCFTPNGQWTGTNNITFYTGSGTTSYAHMQVFNSPILADGSLYFGIPYNLYKPSDGSRPNVIAGTYYFIVNNTNGTSTPAAFTVPAAPSNWNSSSLNIDGEYQSVAWNGNGYGVVYGKNGKIYFAKLDSNGNKLNEVVLANAPNYVFWTNIVWDGSKYGVVWPEANPHNLRFATMNIDGNVLSNIPLTAGTDNADTERPALLWTGSEYVVAWSGGWPDNFNNPYLPAHIIYFTKIASNGQTIVVNKKKSITSGDTRAANGPIISLAWNGTNFGVTWQDIRNSNDSNNPALYFATLDSAGNKLGNDIKISGNGRVGSPKIFADGSNYAVFWRESSIDNVNANSIYATKLDSAGNKIIPNQNLNTKGDNEMRPSIAKAGSDYGIVWTSYPEQKLYFKSINSGFAMVLDNELVSATAGDNDNAYAVWGNNKYGIIWTNIQNNQLQLYFGIK